MKLKVSDGNTKMGSIPSVSLPSGITCRNDCECCKKCYAKRMEKRRPNVRKSYMDNYSLLCNDNETYWRELEASVMMSHFFRFHVSGDIPDKNYFQHMISVAKRNQHCMMLCFTKKYDIVNEFLRDGGVIPQNLQVIFSVWRGLAVDNVFKLPEAHVRYRDGTTTAKSDAKKCGGNCTECAITDCGCWVLRKGEQIIFDEH